MFLNLNCLMGCEGVSAGRAQARGDVGEILQSACLSHLSAASAEMLSKMGACGRADRARELSIGDVPMSSSARSGTARIRPP